MNEIAKQLLICLVAAHFVGDFILQSDKDASNKLKPLILLKHSVIVATLSYVFCGVWAKWQIPLVIFCTHMVIDWIKEKIAGRDDLSNKWEIYAFLADQAAHILIITALVFIIVPAETAADTGVNTVSLFWVQLFRKDFLKLLMIISGAILAIKAGGILIGMAVKPFLDELEKADDGLNQDIRANSQGFENGGKVIGYLERGLIFLFILTGYPAGIGFLIAAKSIFPFWRNQRPTAQDGG